MDAWTAELRRWPMIIVLVIGQISNILTVLVLSRPKLRKNTCSLYLIGASVSNTVCLFVAMLFYPLSSGFGYSFQSKSRVLCKLLPYLYYSTIILASWFILLACIDRYCSTHSRAIIRHFSRIIIAKRILILLSLFALLVHIHFLIYMDWIQAGLCTFTTFTYLIFFYIYYVVGYALLTPILYVIFAVLTIYNVKKAKRRVAQAMERCGSVTSPPQRRQTLNAQLLRMLLVQVCSFVILTMPLAAWNIYNGITYYWPKTALSRSLQALLLVGFRYMTFINIGSTCAIYALTGRLFRQELLTLFRWQLLKNALRSEQHFRLFTVTPRISPVS